MKVDNNRSNTIKAFIILEDGEVYPENITVSVDRIRTFEKKICKACGNIYYSRRSSIHNSEFCSRECQISSHYSIQICKNCGREFKKKNGSLKSSKNQIYFCSRKCKDEAQKITGNCPEIRPSHYGNLNSNRSYRVLAFRTFGKKCKRCGYDEIEKMLDVHHKDGNRNNNNIENLEVLCVWCHAIETRTRV